MRPHDASFSLTVHAVVQHRIAYHKLVFSLRRIACRSNTYCMQNHVNDRRIFFLLCQRHQFKAVAAVRTAMRPTSLQLLLQLLVSRLTEKDACSLQQFVRCAL